MKDIRFFNKNIQLFFHLHNDSLSLPSRDETIWRYIDTVSIRWLTIRIVAQRDISRYDLDINLVIRGSHHVVSIFCIWRVFRIRSRDIISAGVVCVKCLLKWTFRWTILHLQWLKMVKGYSIEKCFKRSNFHCLVKHVII